MWAVLAVIVFLAGQAYLFHSLGKVDGFLAQQEEVPEKEILSLAFSDPGTAERMAQLLAGFSRENPEVEMVRHTATAVPEAVYEGRAAVGFLSGTFCPRHGLNSFVLELENLPEQQVIWKTGMQADSTDAFLQYLGHSSGNSLKTVI